MPLHHLMSLQKILIGHENFDNDQMFFFLGTDIALEILKISQILSTTNIEKNIEALHELARKPIAFGSKSQLSFWKRCLNC